MPLWYPGTNFQGNEPRKESLFALIFKITLYASMTTMYYADEQMTDGDYLFTVVYYECNFAGGQ